MDTTTTKNEARTTPIPIYLIHKEGEPIYGLPWWVEGGWNLHPVTAVPLDGLALPHEPGQLEREFLCEVPEGDWGRRVWCPPQWSLWETWIRTLIDIDEHTPGKGGVVIAECDTIPCIPQEIFLKVLPPEKEIADKGVAFVRLYNTLERAIGAIDVELPIWFDSFERHLAPTARIGRMRVSANSPEIWGTHAIYIPEGKAKTVAEAIAAVKLPVDLALEFCVAHGILVGAACGRNLFVQMMDDSPFRPGLGMTTQVQAGNFEIPRNE